MPTKVEIERFSKDIRGVMVQHQISVLDAVLHHATKIKLEVEVAAQLLSEELKQELKIDAERLNLLTKTSRLPL